MPPAPTGLQEHPVCSMFRTMTDAEYAGLRDNIASAKLRNRTVLLWNGVVVDGRHTLKACIELKIKPKFEVFKGTEAEMVEYVLGRNLHRRHETRADRQQWIDSLLKADPSWSDRRIGEATGANHETVGTRRVALVAGGEIRHLEKHHGKDGKTQSASKTTSSATSDKRPKILKDREIDISPKFLPDLKAAKLKKAAMHKFCDLIEEGKSASQALKIAKAYQSGRDLDHGAAAKRDGVGEPIPEHLVDVFGDPFLTTSDEQLHVMLNTAKSAQKWNPFLGANLIEAITQVREMIQNAMPHAVHHACQAKGCSDCRRAGWLPEWRVKEEGFTSGN